MEDGPRFGVPATYFGDPDKSPGSWLQPGSDPAVVAIWRANQQMKDLCLSLYFCNPGF